MNLTELNGEELQARLDQLTAEVAPEARDSLSEEELESRAGEIEAIKAEIENRKNAAAEEARKSEEVAKMKGDPVIKPNEEDRNMDINSKEYRDLWLILREDEETGSDALRDHPAPRCRQPEVCC